MAEDKASEGAEGKAVLDRLFAKVSFSYTKNPLDYVALIDVMSCVI